MRLTWAAMRTVDLCSATTPGLVGRGLSMVPGCGRWSGFFVLCRALDTASLLFLFRVPSESVPTGDLT